MRYLLAILLVCSVCIRMCNAAVALPSIFSDNMVIQQSKPFKIWGMASPDEKVTVDIRDNSQSTTADKSGNWSLVFPSMQASYVPFEIKIKGENSVYIKNVLVGEVWLCSGQSNMQFRVGESQNGATEARESANKNIRFFNVPNVLVTSPQKNVPGSWQICAPGVIDGFSAVGYFFIRELQRELNVPVGIIGSSWGGTYIETWIPMEYLEKLGFMAVRVRAAQSYYADAARYEKTYNNRKADVLAENVKLLKETQLPENVNKAAGVNCDDSAWKSMAVPGPWESNGLPDFDGVVWFRKTVIIPDGCEGKDMMLYLGKLDDFDVTYFNGKEVGRTGSMFPNRDSVAYTVSRKYKIPGRLVKKGNNVITVKIADDLMGGGFAGPAEEMYLASASDANVKIPLTGEWKYNPAGQFKSVPELPQNPSNPACLYMGMINPIAGYPIKGVIWYQGEANAGNALQYRTLMPTMIAAWRDIWDDQSLVFIQTQLANFARRSPVPAESDWANLREAQTMTAEKDPLGGMAVIIDIGDAADIHPRNKQDVGKRLALQARKIAYKQDIQDSSPIFKSMRIKNSKVYLTFKNTYGGLHTRNGEPVTGFAIAGKDGKFVWATAAIEADNVVVWSDSVKAPAAVRYAWDDNPDCNVYNSADLPMSPFRTDKK